MIKNNKYLLPAARILIVVVAVCFIAYGVHCGKCTCICRMDVDPVKNPQSAECIRCGECAAARPAEAVRLGLGVFKKKEAASEKKTSSCAGSCPYCKNCKGK